LIFADVLLFRHWNPRGFGTLEEGQCRHHGISCGGDQFIALGDMPMFVGVLITFLVVILILYLINMLPLDGRAKQICRVVVIVLGIISLLKYIAVF
jgi:hypothetical protein